MPKNSTKLKKSITVLQLIIAVATLVLAVIQVKENKPNFSLMLTLLGGGGIAGLLSAVKALLPEDKKPVISDADAQKILEAYIKAKSPKNVIAENTDVIQARDITREIEDVKSKLISELHNRLEITKVNTENMGSIEKILDHTNLPTVLVNAMRELYAVKDTLPNTEFTLEYATDLLNMLKVNNMQLREYNQKNKV